MGEVVYCGHRDIREVSVFFAQFCCGPKVTLSKTIKFLIWKKGEKTVSEQFIDLVKNIWPFWGWNQGQNPTLPRTESRFPMY